MSEFVIKNIGIERILDHMKYWIEDSKKEKEECKDIEAIVAYASGKLLMAEFVEGLINNWKEKA